MDQDEASQYQEHSQYSTVQGSLRISQSVKSIAHVTAMLLILLAIDHLATKVFIGKLPATRGVWVIIG